MSVKCGLTQRTSESYFGFLLDVDFESEEDFEEESFEEESFELDDGFLSAAASFWYDLLR